ncbi:GNAT family N-acetyltransferase [Pleomorphomonas diazotrophica]|uniref:GNAT family N-acetyltransferase n=1 Tax=Pleomorphomonas diazotrophica TaxID=1166257 RepID=A0A1I4TUT4_9HYPH|nr:GNAT family protein [Pleomorphomonas diazotrophica]PKR87688.1 GNAT family N-acetyltransferase [Pleomorphomonas diazotrophica]SFM80320.1 Protein N-acetyltransferase, RimJ/RimL family [Pleomorphomonas diazotrophica]
MAAPLRVVPATPELLAPLPGWFPTPEALAQWGGSALRFPLDAAQIDAMLSETVTEPPLRLAFVGLLATETVAHAQIVLDWTDGIARLARFAIAPSHRSQGLARPFLADVFARLDEVGDFPRLELNVYTFNTPAIALYESLGFVCEGVRRSSVKVGNARWDTAIYAIIRES